MITNIKGEHIKTRLTIHRCTGEEFLAIFKRKGVAMPSSTIAGEAEAVARIDHGRWLADCPSEVCAGAELVDFEDTRFFCLSCNNEEWGGQWLPVRLPDEETREAVETALLERPHSNLRHWHERMSLLDLQADNLLLEPSQLLQVGAAPEEA